MIYYAKSKIYLQNTIGVGIVKETKKGFQMSKQKVKRPGAYANLKAYIEDQVTITETGCWEWPTVDGAGYAEVCLDGVRRGLHRVSFEEFNGKIFKGCHVCHHCDNPRCVNPDHLFQAKQKANMQNMARKGRGKLGKLTRENVVRMKNLFKTGKYTIAGMARKYGVTQMTIRSILRGDTWLGVGVDLSMMANRIRLADPAKLTLGQVKEIRGLIGKVSLGEIGRMYGVSARAIYDIREGKTWRGR